MVNDELNTFIGYIYKITNIDTLKVYIGQTRKSVHKRLKLHLKNAFKSTSSTYNNKLSRSIRKHGIDRFIIETVKELTATSLGNLCKLLDKEEIYFIKCYKSTENLFGYNISKDGLYTHFTQELVELSIRGRKLFEICTVPGCGRKHLANGYCLKHYNQIYNFGKILERTRLDKNEFVYYDNYAEMILYDKNCKEIARTKIDLDDVPRVKEIKWGYHSGVRGESVVAQKPHVVLHNYLLNHTDKSTVVMHKNGDNLDNRKANLFVVTQLEKQLNNKISKNNKSGVSGVWWCKDRNKWQALIQINGKTKSLGRFNTLEEAVAARKAAEKIYYNKW